MHFSGKINQIAQHFDLTHPENRQGNVATELNLLKIFQMEQTVMHLVVLGPFNFYVYLKTDLLQRNIYMTVQLVGTTFSASKWTYEIHVYNKRQPRRKLTYTDICHSNTTPINEIFNESKCVTIPQSYAMTYFSESTLTYKFFISKDSDNDTRGNRVGRGRGRGGRGRGGYST